MKVTPCAISGAFLLDLSLVEDERGFFARTYCESEFTEHGLVGRVTQCSVSYNHRAGTVRGMHFQRAPYEEVKLVRCTRGAIHDVLLDLRPDSPTYRSSFSTILSAENRRTMYVPPGVAHGFQTLEDGTEVFYQMSESYAPAAASGVRWNDPAFDITWPLEVSIISERDRYYPDHAG